MNPSIEVQITARLDQLDAGLKVAEAKINHSAMTMGKAGEQGGNAFVENLALKIIKGTAILGVTTALGGVLLNAVKGMNAQRSGVEIMTSISDGLVAAGKSLPIVGIFYAAFEEVINGADRFAEELTKKLNAAVEKRIELTKNLMDMLKASADKTEDIKQSTIAGDDPQKMLDEEYRNTDIDDLKELNDAKLAEDKRYASRREHIQAENKAAGARGSDHFNSQMRRAEQEHLAKMEEIRISAEKRDDARQAKFQASKKKIDKDAAKTAEDATKAATEAQEKADKESEANYDRFVKGNIDDAKRMTDAKIQAQQDIIDAEKKAQAQIDKVGRLDKLAGDAARGMINSGQTALGQFNFAQSGSGSMAITLAQKQVNSLEKIEAATAEQVRLQKEMAGFR